MPSAVMRATCKLDSLGERTLANLVEQQAAVLRGGHLALDAPSRRRVRRILFPRCLTSRAFNSCMTI